MSAGNGTIQHGLLPPERLNERVFLVRLTSLLCSIKCRDGYQPIFKALIWTFAAIAFPFLPFRLFVRWRVFRKLFVDDVCVVLAYCLPLVYAIMWQHRAHDLYVVFDVASGFTKPDTAFIVHFGRYSTAQVVYGFTYPPCLWSIKLSFLLFFRRLGRHVTFQKVIWWSAFVLASGGV